MNDLVIPGFYPCDLYSSGWAVIGVDGKWYRVEQSSLNATLRASIDDPKHGVRKFLSDEAVQGSADYPSGEGISGVDFALPVPLSGNEIYGLGPLSDDGTSVTCFLKANGQGSPFGHPVAVVEGQRCNAELELLELLFGGKPYAISFGCDLGVMGSFDDSNKGYPGAAGFARRIHIGNGPLPDARLRLEISDESGVVKFRGEAGLADYLKSRNPEVLLPIFLRTERGAQFAGQMVTGQQVSGQRGVGIMMGAAVNTGSNKSDPFLVQPGMSLQAYVDDVLVLKHPIGALKR